MVKYHDISTCKRMSYDHSVFYWQSCSGCIHMMVYVDDKVIVVTNTLHCPTGSSIWIQLVGAFSEQKWKI